MNDEQSMSTKNIIKLGSFICPQIKKRLLQNAYMPPKLPDLRCELIILQQNILNDY